MASDLQRNLARNIAEALDDEFGVNESNITAFYAMIKAHFKSDKLDLFDGMIKAAESRYYIAEGRAQELCNLLLKDE